MNLDLTPTKIDIDIESLSLDRNAFYNICFIAENDIAQRTVEVYNLKDLLDAGYIRGSLAYNFCVAVLSQDGIPNITVRAKRNTESYQDAYQADDNSGYYFLVIQSKNKSVISEFNSFLVGTGENKLQFYSSNSETITTGNLVHYYHELIDVNKDVTDATSINLKDHYINLAYNLGYITKDLDKVTANGFQRARLAYPEAAWISKCGSLFPSSVMWLYKYLPKVEVTKVKTLPNLSTTSNMVINNKATVGSGTTNQGIVIHEQVSLDWLKWALSKKVWDVLYNNGKVGATENGATLIINEVKQVLDVALEQSIFSEYNISGSVIDRRTNKISISFTAKLVQSILNVEVSGSLRY